MAADVTPSAASCAAASSTAPSSRGMRTLPSTAIRSGTSSRQRRGTSGAGLTILMS